MASLYAEDFADLVAATLRDLGPPNYQNIAQNKQHYELVDRWFSPGNMANIKGRNGIGIQRQLMNRLPDSAAHVGFIDPDDVNIYDLADQLQVTWVHAKQSWGVFYQESLMNAGAEQIFDIIKMRRDGAMINLFEEIEEKGWLAPTSSSDKRNPWGIAYWVVPNATTGFNGGAASGHTTVAGISLTDSPNFKNYTWTATAGASTVDGFSKTDALPSMRLAMMMCKFRSPIPGNDYVKNPGKYCLYTNKTVINKAETIGESQNESLGNDLAPAKYGVGELMFRGFPLRWVPELDSDTTNPIYGIDHSTFEVNYLKGDWFRESKKGAATQHNVVEYFIDLTYNYLCIDRRRNFVGYFV